MPLRLVEVIKSNRSNEADLLANLFIVIVTRQQKILVKGMQKKVNGNLPKIIFTS